MPSLGGSRVWGYTHQKNGYPHFSNPLYALLQRSASALPSGPLRGRGSGKRHFRRYLQPRLFSGMQFSSMFSFWLRASDLRLKGVSLEFRAPDVQFSKGREACGVGARCPA